jgi:hypothetical protein
MPHRHDTPPRRRSADQRIDPGPKNGTWPNGEPQSVRDLYDKSPKGTPTDKAHNTRRR